MDKKDTQGIGEKIIKQIYQDNIKEMPTFDEKMQKHIQEELEKMKKEYIEYLKNKEKSNEVVEDDNIV